MQTIARQVREIESDQRRWIEATIGQPLSDNQQVLIHVIDVGGNSDLNARAAALEKAAEIARQGRTNVAAQVVGDAELDAAIEEAVDHARGHRS